MFEESVQFGEVVVTYFGGSSFLLQHGDVNVYIDPVGVGFVHDELKADIIFISHEHAHAADSHQIELLLTEETCLYGPQSVEDAVGPDVQVVFEGEEGVCGDVRFVVVPAYTEGSSEHPRDKGFGYEIWFGGVKFYFAGFTDYIPGMKDRDEIDVAFLPIGEEGVMDFRDAADAVRDIGPKVVVPMLYTADMDNPVDNFAFSVKSMCQVVIMHPQVLDFEKKK